MVNARVGSHLGLKGSRCVREAVAMGECLTSYINTKENFADLMTKSVPDGELREHLVSGLMSYIYPRNKK